MGISLILMFCGCTQTSNNEKPTNEVMVNNTTSINTTSNINNNVVEHAVANIKYIIPENSGNKTLFNFAFEDKNGKLIKAEGSVRLEVIDKLGNCVLNKTYDLSSIPYSSGKYIVSLNSSEIGKGMDTQGIVILTYQNGNKVLSKSNSIMLQKYSEEELKKIFEEEYLKNAKEVNIKQTRGNFEITIVRHGYFKIYNAEKNKVDEVYRVDMIVKNLIYDSVQFNPMDIYIIDDSGNKYRYINGGSLKIGTTINGDKQLKGYFLFEDVPKDAKDLRLQFRLGQIDGSGYNVFDFDIGQP